MRIFKFLIFIICALPLFIVNESCRKENFNIPVCDSNCVRVNAIFYDSTLNKPFSNKKISVYLRRSIGIGMGRTKLWDIMTNSNGEANFDISYDKLRSNGPPAGFVALYICDKKYSDKGFSGNSVNLTIRESDIGQIVVQRFNLFKE
jgi:hypothetical protein